MQKFLTVGSPVNIFHILHESPFSLLIIISAASYVDRDIKMRHSISRAILKKKLYCNLLAFSIINIVGNLFYVVSAFQVVWKGCTEKKWLKKFNNNFSIYFILMSVRVYFN